MNLSNELTRPQTPNNIPLSLAMSVCVVSTSKVAAHFVNNFDSYHFIRYTPKRGAREQIHGKRLIMLIKYRLLALIMYNNSDAAKYGGNME